LAVCLGVLALSGCGPYQKAKLDREVDRLCAIDGGVHIYETVRLPKENFGPDGEVFPQYQHLVASGGDLGPNFAWQLQRDTLIAGDPSLTRWSRAVIRLSDGQKLIESIDYMRAGGDLPGPAAPSQYGCKNVAGRNLLSAVFLKEEAK
jgi:hypothetical protein